MAAAPNTIKIRTLKQAGIRFSNFYISKILPLSTFSYFLLASLPWQRLIIISTINFEYSKFDDDFKNQSKCKIQGQ